MQRQERRKTFKSGGPQRLNRIVLPGKNLITMEKLYNLEGHDHPGSSGFYACAQRVGHWTTNKISHIIGLSILMLSHIIMYICE